MGDSLRSSSRPAAKITAGEPWKPVPLGAHPTGSCAGTRTSVFSPPGRGRGWVGSRGACLRFFAYVEAMHLRELQAGALASWTAAVLCRFCVRGPDLKAPEDWRTPKPGGTAAGSWGGSIRFGACVWTLNPPLTPPRRGSDRTRTNVCSPLGRGRGWVGSWK